MVCDHSGPEEGLADPERATVNQEGGYMESLERLRGSRVSRGYGVAVFLVLTLLSAGALAAQTANAYIVGAVQGPINGDVIQVGREGSIEVLSFGYNVSAPYDPATGLPSGKRQHRPVRILKNIDSSSPLLFNALVNNEPLTSVRIEFWRPDRAGAESQYYTVELVNAHIVSIMPSQVSGTSVPEQETLSLTFEQIITTFNATGGSGRDTW